MADKTEILYDHYKDTCSIIGEAVKRRERSMFYLVLVLAFFTFQAIFPSAAAQVVETYLAENLGITSGVDISILGAAVWFLVFTLSLRYFQTAIFIERQYDYIHQLEDRLNESLEISAITREGKGYLKDYPAFSNWAWIVYTTVLPIVLFVAALAEIIREWCAKDWEVEFALLFNSLMFVFLLITIVLYLWKIHDDNWQARKKSTETPAAAE